MYYLIMKTAFKPDLSSRIFCISKIHTRLKDKEMSFIDYKLYQKLLVVFISMSSILIIPESPRELENICETHNSKKLCNVW